MDTYKDLKLETKLNPLLIYYAIIETFNMLYEQKRSRCLLAESIDNPIIELLSKLYDKDIKFSNPYDLQKSHYLKGTTIKIITEDGNEKVGTIRIANHTVNLATFCKNNNYDFAISIVIGNEEAYYDDVSTDLEREIHIAQYIVDTPYINKRGNKIYREKDINYVANEIDKIIKQGYKYAENFVYLKNFEEITNPGLNKTVFEDKIFNAIKNGIIKALWRI